MRENKNLETYFGSVKIDYKRESIWFYDASSMESSEVPFHDWENIKAFIDRSLSDKDAQPLKNN